MPGRLAQVASNLISNALQYGDPSEPVLVELDGTRADSVEMAVSNAGNIPPDLCCRRSSTRFAAARGPAGAAKASASASIS